MSTKEQIKEVELTIEQSKKLIAKKECVDRLLMNPDFQEIILNDYFKSEASRLVLLKADPAIHGSDARTHIEESINGIGALNGYLHRITQLGTVAAQAIAEDTETLEELEQESLNEE